MVRLKDLVAVALKVGFSLSSRIAQISGVASNAVFLVTDIERGQWLLVCPDTGTDAEIARALESTRGDLFACRAVALEGSSRLFSCCSVG
ncbi:MAG: hypothetical protein C4346_12500 [Chloroflexota bacterium]